MGPAAIVVSGSICVISCDHYTSCSNCNVILILGMSTTSFIECVKCHCKMVRGRCNEGTTASYCEKNVTLFEDVIKWMLILKVHSIVTDLYVLQNCSSLLGMK